MSVDMPPMPPKCIDNQHDNSCCCHCLRSPSPSPASYNRCIPTYECSCSSASTPTSSTSLTSTSSLTQWWHSSNVVVVNNVTMFISATIQNITSLSAVRFKYKKDNNYRHRRHLHNQFSSSPQSLSSFILTLLLIIILNICHLPSSSSLSTLDVTSKQNNNNNNNNSINSIPHQLPQHYRHSPLPSQTKQQQQQQRHQSQHQPLTRRVSKRPFYTIAHMVNSLTEIEQYLGKGANGIEADVYFAPNGSAAYTFHGYPCDCFRHCGERERLDVYLERVRELTTPGTKEYNAKFVLLLLDLKLHRIAHSAKALAGQNLAQTMMKHLYNQTMIFDTTAVTAKTGSQVYTIISIGHVFDYDFILGFQNELESSGKQALFHRYIGWDIGLNDPIFAIESLWKRMDTIHNIWQGDGRSNCVSPFYNLARLTAIIKRRDQLSPLPTFGALTLGTPRTIIRKVYQWTVDLTVNIRTALRANVDAIITNHPERVIHVMGEREFVSRYRMATGDDSPWERVLVKPTTTTMTSNVASSLKNNNKKPSSSTSSGTSSQSQSQSQSQPQPGTAAASTIMTNPSLGLKLVNGAGDMLDSFTKYVVDLLRYRTPVRYLYLSTYANKRRRQYHHQYQYHHRNRVLHHHHQRHTPPSSSSVWSSPLLAEKNDNDDRNNNQSPPPPPKRSTILKITTTTTTVATTTTNINNTNWNNNNNENITSSNNDDVNDDDNEIKYNEINVDVDNDDDMLLNHVVHHDNHRLSNYSSKFWNTEKLKISLPPPSSSTTSSPPLATTTFGNKRHSTISTTQSPISLWWISPSTWSNMTSSSAKPSKPSSPRPSSYYSSTSSPLLSSSLSKPLYSPLVGSMLMFTRTLGNIMKETFHLEPNW